MELLNKKIAGVDINDGNVVIDCTSFRMPYKHYNVVVTKKDDLYTITAEEALYDIFFDREDDPEVVNQFVDEHVYRPAPMLGFINVKPYLKGWSEKKERRKVKYITNNITIKE